MFLSPATRGICARLNIVGNEDLFIEFDLKFKKMLIKMDFERRYANLKNILLACTL